MNDDLRQWSNGNGRVKPKEHPFTIDNAPGDFDDIRPDPRTAKWEREMAANPKPKYTRGDMIITVFVVFCWTAVVAICLYMYFHWR